MFNLNRKSLSNSSVSLANESSPIARPIMVLAPSKPITSDRLINTQYITDECIDLMIQHINNQPSFTIQGGIPEVFQEYFNQFLKGENSHLIKHVEDLLVLITLMFSGKVSLQKTIFAFGVYIKLRDPNPLVSTIYNSNLIKKFCELFNIRNFEDLDENDEKIFFESFNFEEETSSSEFQVQGAMDSIATLRDLLDKYESIKHSELFKKLHRFMMYVLSASLFEKAGITFDTFRYSMVEQEAIKKQHHLGLDFILCITDTILFICEKGAQIMSTGNLNSLLYSSSTYETWFIKANTLRTQSDYLANPEAFGIDKFSYLADLSEAIEVGDSLYQRAAVSRPLEKRMVLSLLNDLKRIRNIDLTKREAMKDRPAPFGILIYGASSIGKSTLTNIFYKHYGKLFNLNTSPEFKYTRNPTEEYWTNFSTSQWCIQLDDVGFLNPGKALEDRSIMEMLQVINNVPYVPAQAELADKGKTPIRSKLVIATTNTNHLNAFAYFACPLAVQRRLPWVIEAKVKPEYSKHDIMLDPTLVPFVPKGEYSNFWNFTVHKVVPDCVTKGQRHTAKLEEAYTFSCIYELMAWYSKVALEFEELQKIVLVSNDNLEDIILCLTCHMPEIKCTCPKVQGLIEHLPFDIQDLVVERGILFTIKAHIFAALFVCYFSFEWFRSLTNFVANYFGNIPFLDEGIYRKVLRFDCVLKRAKVIVTSSIYLTHIAALIAQFVISYKVSMWLFAPRKAVQNVLSKEIDITKLGSEICPDKVQVNNPWKNVCVPVTALDFSAASKSNRSPDNLLNKVAKNSINFKCTGPDYDITLKFIVGRALCVNGRVFIANNHTIMTHGDVKMEIKHQDRLDGITSNEVFYLRQDQITRYPQHDLCSFELPCAPYCNLVEYFCNDKITGGFDGMYVLKDLDGKIEQRSIQAIGLKNFTSTLGSIDTWFGVVKQPTVMGDCGAVMVGVAPLGSIILGLHYLGGDNYVGSLRVTRTMILNILSTYNSIPVISGGLPILDAPSGKVRALTEVHTKSTTYYIQKGNAVVFGSLTNEGATRKSRVKSSVINPYLLKYNYTQKHFAPNLTGWKPWRIAALEMVEPNNSIDGVILDKCVDAYLNDIFSTNLDLSRVKVLTLKESINGCPGVAYIDGINRSTSAGFPWNCSKMHFLEPDVDEKYPDGVKFNTEMMDEITKVLHTYRRGERVMPIFSGSLKDEAISQVKIDAGKARVFTGSPLPWSTVVRMHLLSVVKLIQDNRELFEAYPGTITQSSEWGKIRQHLCKFGEDTMFAGDFKSFDKKMPPAIMYSAFKILYEICKKAGYTAEELQVVWGIAEDTIHPIVNFNGDLIMFLSLNPSGHPLTVIINCLANALYMRYVYYKRNPKKECMTFKNNVALITYGDDGAGGVSPNAPWFNHTAIVEVLAEVGVTYTMADKLAVSVPYINIKDVSFLKRTWRYDIDVGAWLCPLEHDSIEKMLMVNVASKEICANLQAVDVIGSAIREYFHYGKEIFEAKTLLLQNVIVEAELSNYVSDSVFPSWESLALAYKC